MVIILWTLFILCGVMNLFILFHRADANLQYTLFYKYNLYKHRERPQIWRRYVIFSVSFLKFKNFQVDSGLLVLYLIQSSHHLNQDWLINFPDKTANFGQLTRSSKRAPARHHSGLNFEKWLSTTILRDGSYSIKGRTGFGIFWDFFGDFYGLFGIFWDFLEFLLKSVRDLRDFFRVIYTPRPCSDESFWCFMKKDGNLL